MKYKNPAFIFPGQGAQYPGMGQDFIENFSAARFTFEEADDVLGRKLSDVILKGSDAQLTETANSQPAIYVVSIAILRVMQEIMPMTPVVCAGLSLGEYSALTASEILPFLSCLPLIQHRATFMNEACKRFPGTMAVVVGLDSEVVNNLVKKVNLPNDLWIANYNCPGQVVLSGTARGVQVGSEAAQKAGAKRILPLPVQGAFHSGLMNQAEKHLAEYINHAPLNKGSSKLVMNVPGDFVDDLAKIRNNLIKQVTSPVSWEQGIRAMDNSGIDLYVEIGPGKTLMGMNKRIGVKAPTFSVETIEDLDKLANELRG